MKTSTFTDYYVGQFASIERTFTKEDLEIYAKFSREFNEVYNTVKDAWESFFKAPIIPGLLPESLIIEVISKKLPGTACVLLQKEIVYSQPIYLGDTIRAELQIIDINHQRNWITQKITCINQHGNEVIKGQVVVFLLPEERKRK